MIALFESNKILRGDTAAEGQNFKVANLARVETPCKIIASITRSITNSTLLMHIINLFPSHSIFELARPWRWDWLQGEFWEVLDRSGVLMDRGGNLRAFSPCCELSRSPAGVVRPSGAA